MKKTRNHLITSIHVAKRKTCMDEDTYRAYLKRITGKESLRAMNDTELSLLSLQIKYLAFEGQHQKDLALGLGKAERIKKIKAMCFELGKDKGYGSAIGVNMFGKRDGTTRGWVLEELTEGELSKVIAALNYQLKRKQKREGGER